MMIRTKRVLAVVISMIICATIVAYGEGDPWDCPECNRTGNTGNYCGGCGHPAPWITDTPGSGNLSSGVKVGDTILFGRYPQTEDGTDETPIEWIVLDVDEANNRALLISKYGLAAKPYNTRLINVTWETCSLRIWLNSDFLSQSFDTEEQAIILLTDVDNSDTQGYSEWNTTGGNNTKDYIFLLSYAEANRYLNVTYNVTYGDRNIIARVAPTAYAIEYGAHASSNLQTMAGSGAGWWWLRSPGDGQIRAARVNCDGSLGNWYANNDACCVRPALWVNLESDIF